MEVDFNWTDEDACFEAGRQACRKGVKFNQNPFVDPDREWNEDPMMYSNQYHAWERGYAAEILAKIQK